MQSTQEGDAAMLPRHERAYRDEKIIPTLAVVVMALMTAATVLFVTRTADPLASVIAQEPAAVSSPAPSVAQAVAPPPATPLPSDQPLVSAPPLAPLAAAPAATARAPTQALGGPAACRDCGVVELVVAVHDPGKKKPRAYQMHVRMDDGKVRTFEQRGALAAGSRVRVERGSLKVVKG